MADSVMAIHRQEPTNKFAPVAGPAHTLFLLLVLAGVAYLGYLAVRSPAAVTSNRVVTYSLTAAWEWAAFGYIYWGLRRRGKSLRDIAGDRWKSVAEFFMDVALSFGFWISSLIILYIVARLVHAAGAQETARSIAPRNLVETLLWIGLSITAGICEETIFRGYFQRQFAAWTRNPVAGVVVSAALFGAGHIYQGGRATIVIGVYGLLFGILAETRSNLRPGIIVHAWHDSITGLALEFLVRHGRLLRAAR